MTSAFNRICFVCLCIVIASVPIFVFDMFFLDRLPATVFECRSHQLAGHVCYPSLFRVMLELIVALPFGLVIALTFLLRSSIFLNDIVPATPAWTKFAHPMILSFLALDLILALALVHVVRVLAQWGIGRWRARRARP